MVRIGQPFLVENRPQTFLSRFLTTKSVVPGEPKVVRRPSGTIIQLIRSLTNTKKEISHPESVSFVISSRSPKNRPKSAKIAKIRVQKLEFLPTYIENRKFFLTQNVLTGSENVLKEVSAPIHDSKYPYQSATTTPLITFLLCLVRT